MNVKPDQLEVEVKFYIRNTASLQERLKVIGSVAQKKVFETNVRFEDQDCSLIKTNRLLRLRQDDTCRLTYKCPPEEDNSECKIYQELEVGISDFETMKALLNALGYNEVQVYEKWRQTFEWENVLICIDNMPYGDFLEIEGPEPGIRKAANILGLNWQKRILSNYLAIFDILRKNNNLPFSDVTFDNFKKHPIDITRYLSLIEVGK